MSIFRLVISINGRVWRPPVEKATGSEAVMCVKDYDDYSAKPENGFVTLLVFAGLTRASSKGVANGSTVSLEDCA